MNILYLANYFPPEIGTGPHLPFDVCECLAEWGHQLTVVTGFPRYNLAVMPSEYRGHVLFRERLGDMTVLRVNVPNFYGSRASSRALVQLLTPPILSARAMAANWPQVVVTDSPPLLLAIGARLVARRFRVPFVPLVMDLFPQTIIDVGLLRNRALIATFERMERWVYMNSSALVVISEGYKRHVLARGACERTTHVIPTWADLESIRPTPRLNTFRSAHGIDSGFVVGFAGTMGFFQGLSTVVDAARRFESRGDVTLLLVGDGPERRRLRMRAEGLGHVRFLPMQSRDVYPDVLAAFDVALVTLDASVKSPVVPSKIMTIMAAGRPIIACLPGGAAHDATGCISEAQAGLVVDAGDEAGLAAAILYMKNNPDVAGRMGASGRRYAESHYSKAVCIRRLEGVLTEVCQSRQSS